MRSSNGKTTKRNGEINQMAKKYRYFMSGMFFPTDGEEYEINIPSPFWYDSEDEAMGDGCFGYHFIWDREISEPIVVIFAREEFELAEEKGKRYLNQWAEGKIVKTYSFDEFKKEGGYIRMLKPECKGLGFIDGDTDFLDTNKTFTDVFPNMQKQKMYYIDNEAYYIEEINSEEKRER